MRVCLFEDRGAQGLEPLSLTRPVFDLVCGTSTLATQQLRSCFVTDQSLLVRPELAELARHEHPGTPVNDAAWLRAGPIALINGRWLPPFTPKPVATDSPCVGIVDGVVAYAFVLPEHLPADPVTGIDDYLERLRKTLPHIPAGGAIAHHLWDLIAANPARLSDEFDHRDRIEDDEEPGWRPAGDAVVGPADRLLIDPLAAIDPMVVFDTTNGPITIESGAVVTAFSRIEGPCHIGAGSHILGAKIRGGTTIGPGCRVGGEVECSIMLGNSNKYHDGFLGHSYVGSWVNFGAGSQISDLRNDYGEVTVTLGGAAVRTGQTKLGSLIGDHAKIAIGALLNTGTTIGAFGQVLPAGRLLPKYVPPFCSTRFDRVADSQDVLALLDTAATVMARRGRALTPLYESLYRSIFASTAPERRRGVRYGERRQLRKVV